MGVDIAPAPATDRTQILATALGMISETCPLGTCSVGAALVAQALRGTAIGLRAGDIVTNIIGCLSVAAGGTAGVVNVGLYSSAYGKLAVSGDVQSSLTSTGLVVMALTAPYTITADGLYYCVIDMTTAYGSTQPSLIGSSITGMSVALSGKPKNNWLQSSQASLPTTATPADTATALWFGVS